MLAVDGVERERRDLEGPDVDRLVRVRRQRDVADQVRVPDEEEQRGQEREPLAGHLVVHVAADDVVADEGVDRLDGGLHAVRPRLHAVGDVDHRHDAEDRGDDDVEHALVEVERAGQADPAVELELVLRLELVVVPAGRAEEGDDRDDRAEIDGAGGEQDLLGLAHFAPLATVWRITRQREVDGEGDEHEHGGHQPVLALAGEADGEDGAADDPGAGERAAEVEPDLAADVLGLGGLALERDAGGALEDPGDGADGVAEQRQAGERDEREGGDDEHDVEVAQEGHGLSAALSDGRQTGSPPRDRGLRVMGV